LWSVCDAVGREIQRLPLAERVFGVTSLENYLYVLRRNKWSKLVEVYDIDSYHFQRYLAVPGLGIAVWNLLIYFMTNHYGLLELN